MPHSLILALDIGTSSVRAIAFDFAGHKVGDEVQLPYDQTTTSDGGVEIDAPFLLDLAAKCVDELLSKLENEVEVAALAISCFWHSLLAVDEGGKPLTAALSWADNRAAAYISVLRAHMDEHACHARLGCVFHTSYWPAKLLYLRDTHPDLFSESNPPRWMGFGEWLRLQWCGNDKMSLSMASGTGLFDQNARDFDADTLNHLPIRREQLPELCDLDDAATLSAELQSRWPKLASAKIFPAIGDGACANIGSGCADETRIALSAGTSGALRVVLRDFSGEAPRGLWRYRIDKDRSLVGGALSNAGNVIAWARENLRLDDDWMSRVEQMKPGAHGLTILPFLAGERAPLWNGHARFTLEGASWNTSAETMTRAILEGAALRFAAVAGELLKLSADAQIVFSGGALEKVSVWQQIMCDAIGAPLTQSLESEASARGAALLALEILENDHSKNVSFEQGAQITPNRENHVIYARMLEKQNALYSKIYE